jgi:hypothetical protein
MPGLCRQRQPGHQSCRPPLLLAPAGDPPLECRSWDSAYEGPVLGRAPTCYLITGTTSTGGTQLMVQPAFAVQPAWRGPSPRLAEPPAQAPERSAHARRCTLIRQLPKIPARPARLPLPTRAIVSRCPQVAACCRRPWSSKVVNRWQPCSYIPVGQKSLHVSTQP